MVNSIWKRKIRPQYSQGTIKFLPPVLDLGQLVSACDIDIRKISKLKIEKKDVSNKLNLRYYYYFNKRNELYHHEIPQSNLFARRCLITSLFQSKTQERKKKKRKRGVNSWFQSLAFPRRFPIIRYPTRVPLSRSYVTQRRVSVGVFPKRFMNYVDRWARGRGPIHQGERFWTVGRMLFAGLWWIGICIVRKRGWHSSFRFIESAQSSWPTSRGFFARRLGARRLREIIHQRWSNAVMTIRWRRFLRFFYANCICLGNYSEYSLHLCEH